MSRPAPSLSAIRLDPRPIFEKDPATADDSPLKLLLPPSLRLCDRRDRRRTSCGDEAGPAAALSASKSLDAVLALATSSREMLPRQNGQAGDGSVSVVGFGLLWQHRANVHGAHIW